MDYIEEAKQLVTNLGQRMSPSSYDTAWMSRVRSSCNGKPCWPDLVEWLIEHQRPDGSWGGAIEYYHDRILCTLTAAIALRENDRSAETREAIEKAERYLWHHLHLLPRDPFELVGFELIFPTLLAEARSLGLDVPGHTCGYGAIQAAKLRMIPPQLLYSPKISTVYSLEFLGHSADANQVQRALANNGSLGNSPATTAYYLSLSDEIDSGPSLSYLQGLRDEREHVITVYPFRIFELSWVLNNLIYGEAHLDDLVSRDALDWLQEELDPDGVGFDSAFTVPDGDTTSVCCRVLLHAGREIAPSVLSRFENKEERIFRTYSYERNMSVGTNVHALETLDLMPGYPNRQEVQEQVTVALLDKRQYGVYWVDKWHASPYYATAHTLIALMKQGPHLAHACRHSVDWLLHTQQSDGSWGFFRRGTAEETAYALIALLHYSRLDAVDRDVLRRGAEYLVREYHEADQTRSPELWIAKCLYAPHDIVQSAILAALMLYDELLGL
jgi:halimadienyl-diphosphate synthase